MLSLAPLLLGTTGGLIGLLILLLIGILLAKLVFHLAVRIVVLAGAIVLALFVFRLVVVHTPF